MKAPIQILKNFDFSNIYFYRNESDFFLGDDREVIGNNFAGYDYILSDYQTHTNTYFKKFC
jgi:hypothetical protein